MKVTEATPHACFSFQPDVPLSRLVLCRHPVEELDLFGQRGRLFTPSA
jgi:hypothetical protein